MSKRVLQWLLTAILCTLSFNAAPVRAQYGPTIPGVYSPNLPSLGGYPYPVASLGQPPSLPLLGIPYSDVPPIIPQRTEVTCWAAAMSNLFKFYGFDVSEAQIVHELSPNGQPVLATPEMMAAGMNRIWNDSSGRRFKVESDITNLISGSFGVQCNNACIFNELTSHHPVLMGTTHHAMVMYAIMPNQYGGAYMFWVNDPAPIPGLPDPWAPHPPRSIGTGEQIAYFIAAARVTPCPADAPC